MELLTGLNLAALLTLPGVGEKRAVVIANRFSDWDALKRATLETLVDCLGPKTGEQVLAALSEALPVAHLPDGVHVVSAFEPHYPQHLKSIPDRPALLWWKGTLPSGPTLAVVGTRSPNAFGAAVAQRAASEAASHGIATISGLALGCDSVAHRASLDADTPTWAILGQGIDTLPERGERAVLARRIVDEGGGLMSEVPPGTPVAAHLLTKRNRLQTGIADAVFIAQTGLATPLKPAGTLHTARFALEQGRYLAVAEPPVNLRDDETLAGNVALTSPEGTSPETLHVTNETTVDLLNERRPVADLAVSGVADFATLWTHIRAGRS